MKGSLLLLACASGMALHAVGGAWSAIVALWAVIVLAVIWFVRRYGLTLAPSVPPKERK